MTMPAMAPPLRPLATVFRVKGSTAPPVEVAAGAEEEVDEGNRLPIAVVMGSLTFWQRDSVLENKQQESVALGEEAAQYEQRLPRFDEKPQLLGSFCTPRMQLFVRELAGRAQLVKSARIWVRALSLLVTLQMAGVEAIDCSLLANSAWC